MRHHGRMARQAQARSKNLHKLESVSYHLWASIRNRHENLDRTRVRLVPSLQLICAWEFSSGHGLNSEQVPSPMDSGTLETNAEVALIKDSFDVVTCLDPSQLSTSATKNGSTWPVGAEDVREIGFPMKRRHSRYDVFS